MVYGEMLFAYLRAWLITYHLLSGSLHRVGLSFSNNNSLLLPSLVLFYLSSSTLLWFFSEGAFFCFVIIFYHVFIPSFLSSPPTPLSPPFTYFRASLSILYIYISLRKANSNNLIDTNMESGERGSQSLFLRLLFSVTILEFRPFVFCCSYGFALNFCVAC